MAAYGALVSLMQLIHQIQNHPSPPISIHEKQVESLTENVTFLQEFLDCYTSPVAYSNKADKLEIRIADAAHAAEDILEIRIVDRIHFRSSILVKMVIGIGKLLRVVCRCALCKDDDDMHTDLHKVIEEMNLIKKEVMKINAKKLLIVQQADEVSSSIDHAGSSSIMDKGMMVGVEEVLLEVLDKLTGSSQLNRQIIPIMGMGGIGKTTLARNLFENALVKEHFDIRVWTTISQVSNTRETLREVLCQAGGEDLSSSSMISEKEMGEKLYKHLFYIKYLIVMDDMWSLEVWDKMKFFFPDCNNGSRIVVTTRLSDLSCQLSESHCVSMKFLDDDSSWGLFCETVFVKESVPDELRNIGKKIIAKCRGLPLSIATIGGLLAKSIRTRRYWEYIEENLNSIVIRDNDEYCLRVLKMSYVHLPNYLKPCFLYMGIFGEDWKIRVSTLKKLWVSEGFLKPISGKCLETVAEEYLNELIGRNLILADELGSTGNVKYCKIHDLLRDLCLREGVKERFYRVLGEYNHRNIDRERRIVIPITTPNEVVADAFKSSSFDRARSFICEGKEVIVYGHLELLRTLIAYDKDRRATGYYELGVVVQLKNSRYLALGSRPDSKLPSSINHLWNLQTLVISSISNVTAPVGFWEMDQLRHVRFTGRELCIPHPPRLRAGGRNRIMGNLQTLKGVLNLYLDENVVTRIPNIKKLRVRYAAEAEGERIKSVDCLSYLECLTKLEAFGCWTKKGCNEYMLRIKFPHSLKKFELRLMGWKNCELDDILLKVGSLPLLQKLVLRGGFFRTRVWETIGGQFPSLTLLNLTHCGLLKKWMVSEASHFPLLQELHLLELDQLEEIPSEIGEIATLKSIVLKRCSESVVSSAKRIVEEQEEVRGEQPDFHVEVFD